MKAFKSIILPTALILSISLFSCDPKTPENHGKGHDEAAKIIYTFTPGSLKTDSGIYAHEFTADEAENITRTVEDLDKPGSIEPIKLQVGKWYRLHLEMYNDHGEAINGEFLTPQERTEHQFFYMPWKDGASAMKPVTYLDYKYGDKGSDGQNIDEAIGVTGYIRILETAPAEFTVRTILCHVAPPASKLDPNGKPYPFYAPSDVIMSDLDVDLLLPFSKK